MKKSTEYLLENTDSKSEVKELDKKLKAQFKKVTKEVDWYFMLLDDADELVGVAGLENLKNKIDDGLYKLDVWVRHRLSKSMRGKVK